MEKLNVRVLLTNSLNKFLLPIFQSPSRSSQNPADRTDSITVEIHTAPHSTYSLHLPSQLDTGRVNSAITEQPGSQVKTQSQNSPLTTQWFDSSKSSQGKVSRPVSPPVHAKSSPSESQKLDIHSSNQSVRDQQSSPDKSSNQSNVPTEKSVKESSPLTSKASSSKSGEKLCPSKSSGDKTSPCKSHSGSEEEKNWSITVENFIATAHTCELINEVFSKKSGLDVSLLDHSFRSKQQQYIGPSIVEV